jgi:tetratricopeptide (TPR) repeat protein
MRRAQVLRSAGDLKAAAELYQKAVQADPGDPSALFDLGETLRRDGQIQPAIVPLERALAISPRLSSAWVSKGHALLGQDKREEAAACYRKAMELFPDAAESINPMAAYYLDKNDTASAFPLLDRAIAAGVADSQTYLILGRVHLIQGKDDEARKDFFSAMQLSDDARSTLKQEADIYMVRQKYDEGVARYAEGMRRFPDYADNYLTLGSYYLQVEDAEKALALFRKAMNCPLKPADRSRVAEIVSDLENLIAQPPPPAP